jgi:hypothetical protein
MSGSKQYIGLLSMVFSVGFCADSYIDALIAHAFIPEAPQ